MKNSKSFFAMLLMCFSMQVMAEKVDYSLSTGQEVTINGESYTALKNLIANGNFDDSSLAGWARGNSYASQARTNYIYWYSNDGVDDSPYIYQSSRSSTNSYAIAQHWQIETGKKYYLSFWTRGITNEAYSPVFSLTNLESTYARQNEYGDGCCTLLGKSSDDNTGNVYPNANVSADGMTWVRTSLVFDSEDFTWLQFRLSDSQADIQFDEFFLCELKKTEDVRMRDTLDLPVLQNPTFDNGTNGWYFTYVGNRGTNNYNNNNFMYWHNTWSSNYLGDVLSMRQEFSNVPNGLYRLNVQAFQRNASQDQVEINMNGEVAGHIFINDYRQPIKSIYDEALITNIYDYSLTTPDGRYIPNIDNSWSPVATAFNNGLYENSVYGYVSDGTLSVGIANHNQVWNNSYIFSDNYRLTFIDDRDLAELVEEMLADQSELESAKINSDIKTEILAKLAALAAATTYTDQAQLFATTAYYGSNTLLPNMMAYVELNASAEALRDLITNGRFLNSVSVAESEAMLATFQDAYDNGKLSTEEAKAMKAVLDAQAVRLGYLHLDISVPVQGALGDSVLAKVENFSDVQSIRISGKLNSDDIYTLKNRLTNLIEIDLANLDWKNIPAEQFRDKTQLRRIALPGNLESIGNYAFYNCQNLQTVTFPSTVQTIGSYAFYRTYSFGDIVLPEGLTSLGDWAFQESRLTSIVLPYTLKSINNYAFYNCDYLKTIEFNGQQTIGYEAFNDCDALTSLKFPETLTSIGDYAFHYCDNLRSVECNEGLVSIGTDAFYSCAKLDSVVLPSSLTYIHGAAFHRCGNLWSVTCRSIAPPAVGNYGLADKSGMTLYVPSLSVNVYKQTQHWDTFSILGLNIMPDNITIVNDYNLNWPDSLSFDYKPNVTLNNVSDQSQNYSSLTVNGNSTLSAGLFTMKYDPNVSRNYSNWDGNRYYHRRHAYTSLVNNATVRADNITIELWTRKNTWDFLVFPFDVKVGDIRLAFSGVPFVIRKYDGQKRAEGLTGETWVDMTADSTLHAGVGYIWRSSNGENRNYNGFYLDAMQTVNKNNVFTNQDVEVPLAYYESEFEHNRSWNLIGNPYPCYYDIRAMKTSAPITVWDTYNNNYVAYSPADDSYILNPGQAFFVQRPVDESSITFQKEGRQTNLTVRDVTYDGADAHRRVSSTRERSVFNLSLVGDDQGDRTRFVVNSKAKFVYESACDASKFMSIENPSAQLYTIENGVNYAINERPLGEGLVYVGMQIAKEGIYTLKLDTKCENEVYLIDNMNGTERRFDGTEGYTFTAKAGTYDSRFVIRIGNGDVTGISSVSDPTGKADSYYNLKGIRMQKVQKGIYIHNGKKVVVK